MSVVTSSSAPTSPHVALLPSAGMGHINPICRLATALVNRGCTISLVVPQPTVSAAESVAISSLVSAHPTSIHLINLPISDVDMISPSNLNPFDIRYEAIRRSAHLLPSLLSSSAPVTALIIDIINGSTFIPIAKHLGLPCYLLDTSSASMLSFFTYYTIHIERNNNNNTDEVVVGDVPIPGFRTIPSSSVPPPLREPSKHCFGIQLLENSKLVQKADGILINTFREFEPEAISALKMAPTLPPVFPIGPLLSPLTNRRRTGGMTIDWLDEQPDESVVYVSFGSLAAMSGEQIGEIEAGLERSGQRYLWVVKTKKVDREEEKSSVNRAGNRGLVVNGYWVDQEEILWHRAVGGFVSHCGWNSLTEAAMAGKRVLGWPRTGDQRVNGDVVRRSGLGVWMEDWCWEEGGVVSADEIAAGVKGMMEDQALRKKAAGVGAEARAAVGTGGSSATVLEEFIAGLRTK